MPWQMSRREKVGREGTLRGQLCVEPPLSRAGCSGSRKPLWRACSVLHRTCQQMAGDVALPCIRRNTNEERHTEKITKNKLRGP
jgi:hypothetical protein